MTDLVARLKTEGPRLWRQLSLFQRATLLAVVLATVGALLFLGQWAQQPEYKVAYTKLSESDASSVVAKLKELKIPYELADSGSTIRVPADKVYDTRLQLAAQGLPKGGTVGFELFDKVSFGLTDFAQKLNFQRGLEGELARTISSLSNVEDARVHIAIPQNELFVDREKPTTASVVLRMRPGADLSSAQIRGIVNLVSHSVEGLKPENVTVVDGDGVLLSEDESESLATAGRTVGQRDAQMSYERSLQREVQALLDVVLGPGKAVARVSAALDWDQYEANSETYSPNGKGAQVRSSQESVERSDVPLLDGSTLGGIPTYPQDVRAPAGRVSPDASRPATGSPSPVATPQPGEAVASDGTVAAATAQPRYEKRDTTTNYEISKLVERTVKAPGAVKKLSVAVLLDGQVDDGTIATITKAVSAAVGLDTARGDTIAVSSLPFDRTASQAQERAAREASDRQLYLEIARLVLAVVSILVVVLLARSVIKGLSRTRQAGVVRVAPAAEQRATLRAGSGHLLAAEEALPLVTQREVMELARTQPELLAQIVKNWVEEK